MGVGWMGFGCGVGSVFLGAKELGCEVGVVDGVCIGWSGVSIGSGVVHVGLHWLGVVGGV